MNSGTAVGSMPVKVSVKALPTVTAGLAKLVELVNQYAPPIHAATAHGVFSVRSVRARAKITSTSPAVAITSPRAWARLARSLVDQATAGSSNIRLARTAPATAPV